MDRVNAIIDNPDFRRYIDIINDNERDRIYCRHGFEHLMAVARIMYIDALENNIDIAKDVIYAAALLHDIGRSVSDEYHDSESAKLSVHILELSGYSSEEIESINEAILSHRTGGESVLGDLLYRADKASRDCMFCDATSTCKWKIKNKGIDR